jgi:hypothetical protein
MAAYQSNLDLGREIVVDLEADADFANNRLGPAHRNLQEMSDPPETGALAQAQRWKIGISSRAGNGRTSQD